MCSQEDSNLHVSNYTFDWFVARGDIEAIIKIYKESMVDIDQQEYQQVKLKRITYLFNFVENMGLEPTTVCLQSRCSTIELIPQLQLFGLRTISPELPTVPTYDSVDHCCQL